MICRVCDGNRVLPLPPSMETHVILGPARCWACRGKGTMTLLDRALFWNDTNPAGSWPARFWCLLQGHDWDGMETISYCLRCHAIWDAEYQEARPPARSVRGYRH